MVDHQNVIFGNVHLFIHELLGRGGSPSYFIKRRCVFNSLLLLIINLSKYYLIKYIALIIVITQYRIFCPLFSFFFLFSVFCLLFPSFFHCFYYLEPNGLRNKKLKKKIDVHISVRHNYSKIKEILASSIFEHRITTCNPSCNPGSSRLSWQIIPLCILAGPLNHTQVEVLDGTAWFLDPELASCSSSPGTFQTSQ